MFKFGEHFARNRAALLFGLLTFLSCFSLAGGNQGGRQEGDDADPVLAWNQIAIDVVRAAADLGPGFPSRNMAIVHGAIFDTVNAIYPTAEPYLYQQEAPRSTDLEVAVAGAAYTSLLALYPEQKTLLLSRLVRSLSQCQGGRYKNNGDKILSDSDFRFGAKVASMILASRRNDGSAVETPYNPAPLPGVWLPTLPDFTPAWGPAWGQQKLFLISNRFSYLPPAPPALNSPAYASAVNQVQALGRSDSTARSRDQTVIALFWSYDSPADGSPITLYNENIQVIARQQKNSVTDNARLFALANLAMADAGIVCWLAKYTYTLWRPVQSIRRAAEDGNPATAPDTAWLPLGTANGPFMASTMTPAFPAYVSGHSTFGAATFETLRQFYRKDNVRFTLTSRDTPRAKRTYASFSAAELENGLSRIYMGVHYNFDNANGLALGRSVANEIAKKLPLIDRGHDHR
jgi:hypothetical protein